MATAAVWLGLISSAAYLADSDSVQKAAHHVKRAAKRAGVSVGHTVSRLVHPHRPKADAAITK